MATRAAVQLANAAALSKSAVSWARPAWSLDEAAWSTRCYAPAIIPVIPCFQGATGCSRALRQALGWHQAMWQLSSLQPDLQTEWRQLATAQPAGHPGSPGQPTCLFCLHKPAGWGRGWRGAMRRMSSGLWCLGPGWSAGAAGAGLNAGVLYADAGQADDGSTPA
ncbi:hypothetical protein HaLaN_31979 [Haematococcus lacustris]|uniref:Uncharacterized protein n=1 Tax=Haematococcus lacustris TaxID=44745 RepID=A0A6A0AL07_HAELA|nr:hypothetical protein HaLaN_31979 [Haematococcus lacustris]